MPVYCILTSRNSRLLLLVVIRGIVLIVPVQIFLRNELSPTSRFLSTVDHYDASDNRCNGHIICHSNPHLVATILHDFGAGKEGGSTNWLTLFRCDIGHYLTWVGTSPALYFFVQTNIRCSNLLGL